MLITRLVTLVLGLTDLACDNKVNIGKWSEMSVKKIPFMAAWGRWLVKMSMRVAVWDVIRVSCEISGRKLWENIQSRNVVGILKGQN